MYHLQPGLLQWERVFADPMTTAPAVRRAVHRSVTREFDVPGYRTDAAQQRRQHKEATERQD